MLSKEELEEFRDKKYTFTEAMYTISALLFEIIEMNKILKDNTYKIRKYLEADGSESPDLLEEGLIEIEKIIR